MGSATSMIPLRTWMLDIKGIILAVLLPYILLNGP